MKHSNCMVILLCAPLLLLTNASAPGLPERLPDDWSWMDEFSDQNPRWDWSYRAGTGYHQLIQFPETPTAVEIGITDDSNHTGYSDCSLHEADETHTNGVLEMRLRTSDSQGKGTRGWGFWDGSQSGGDSAWFWYASVESDPNLVGLRAMVVREGQILLNQPITVDMTQWHTYRVDLSPSGTRFYVDGKLAAETDGRPANLQRIELWIDNYRVNRPELKYLDVPVKQSMLIDWVRLSPIESRSPEQFILSLPIIHH